MPRLDGVGVFTSAARLDESGAETVANTAEQLGYRALWVANVRGDMTQLPRLLGATARLHVGTAILSIWDVAATTAARGWAAADQAGPGRALLGVGVSHSALVERTGRAYDRPLSRLRAYLDELDRAAPTVPPGNVLLGANGPRMMALAAERTAGALTYLVTPERTAEHRAELGAGPLLAPEVKVALAPDRAGARGLARAHLAVYLTLPNYLVNLRRMGFDDRDFAEGGSDRLVDALVAGPTVDDVVRRVAEHRAAGADHVCLQVLSTEAAVPLPQWRELAPALT